MTGVQVVVHACATTELSCYTKVQPETKLGVLFIDNYYTQLWRADVAKYSYDSGLGHYGEHEQKVHLIGITRPNTAAQLMRVWACLNT